MSEILTIAVVSDLHCTYGGDFNSRSNTYLLSDLLKNPINKHPVESIKQVIKKGILTADILLCPGDITDRVNKQGLVSGWQFLKEIKEALNAKELIVTIGNHDVDSRNQHKIGAFELIKNIDESIPTQDQSANDSYWRYGYCFLENNDFTILILNSCYNHTSEELAKTTQIQDITLKKIEEDLSKIEKSNKILIGLCHHHPIHHSNSNLTFKDSDFIDQSDKLLLLLEKNSFTLVVHGHKHDPRLIYFNSNLPILASGSFSATANLLDIGAQNTFHLIEINKKSKKGKIISWIYLPHSGWTQRLDSYFPCFTGFGCKVDLEDLAQKCSKWFEGLGKEFLTYKEVVNTFPDMDHLIPSQQERFNELMKVKYKLTFEPHMPNRPERIYRT